MDEKGFLIGKIGKMRRIFSRHSKKSGKLISAVKDGSRKWITVVACIYGDGTWINPVLIYQGQESQVRDTWVTGFDPKEHRASFSASPTGWTNDELGYAWVVEFDKITRKKRDSMTDYRLLIVDGHRSHITIKFLKYYYNARIIIVIFPPYLTHRL